MNTTRIQLSLVAEYEITFETEHELKQAIEATKESLLAPRAVWPGRSRAKVQLTRTTVQEMDRRKI